ncbi:MAG: hypothetical protein WKG07_29735 [Hymenobacter sp.]
MTSYELGAERAAAGAPAHRAQAAVPGPAPVNSDFQPRTSFGAGYRNITRTELLHRGLLQPQLRLQSSKPRLPTSRKSRPSTSQLVRLANTTDGRSTSC